MTSPKTPAALHFSDLHLSPKMLEVLTHLKFTTPTPIQAQAIPVAALGKDVIGIAQTGTGKTLAFSIPLLQQIAKNKKQGLIILPTRELAEQVNETLQKLGKSFGLKTALLIGGAGMGMQIRDIQRTPHVLVGTPGRIIDHVQQGKLKLTNVGVLVLDEADRMLDMGFAPQINQILHHVPRDRQTMLFSATMPAEIVSIAAKHMKMPVRVEVARAGTVAEKVDQELFIIPPQSKRQLLHVLLNQYKGTVLVFSRTKYGAKKLCRSLNAMGHQAAEIHSNLSLMQRRRSLEGFKSGKHRVLVATDIAARGIDVTNIELVINYDLPDNLDDYVHRVGRTGRAGKIGKAISFVAPEQRSKIRMLERIVRTTLTVSATPALPYLAPEEKTAFEPDHRRGSYGRPQYQDRGRGGYKGKQQGHGGHDRRKPSSHSSSSHRGGRKARVHL